jgi:putative FmdB family regulatory protein
MPIYEFYCADCHTTYSFFSRTADTSKRPACPRCGRPELVRQVSVFAISKGRSENHHQDPSAMRLAYARIAHALEELEAEHDHMDHDDPCHAIPMIQRVYETAGMRIPEKTEEVIRRIQAGEDPEKIVEEFGNPWEAGDSPFAPGGTLHGHWAKLMAPRADETLYDF